ncbi:tetratricopeptide repeat protein [Microbispora sp. NEAU-D428]|uniref:tetratricopeptide repeat protein n=1 Tax=Microbispora sitophila TaxID=2771537 RepID=UPI0018676D12|nr:tetratricopeptide repeat protein [Microbispora sitophila]MBE3008890.1 tetratricopeptide repeat protein [Microbispora sitophila]
MDTARVVDVYGHTPGGGWSFGSGYLIAPNLVLTARHVVADDAGTPFDGLIVRFVADGRPLACRLAWAGPAGLDAALLLITDAGAPSCEPVRWGQMAAATPEVACQAVGFPLAMQQPSGVRDTEHLTGTINPGAGLLGGRLHITATSAAPTQGTWVGMSGAGLFCGPLLTGLIVEDPPLFESRRLTAEPVTRLLADPAFRDLVGPDAVLEAVGLARHRPAVPVPSPAYLLRADVEAVRFRSRTEELARLAAWCAGTGTAVRLLTGPGGQGKTRLARELGRRLEADGRGWVVTWWQDSTSPAPLGELTRPMLVVIDYAETRPETVRNVVLAALARGTTAPVRVVLLARSAGDWWRRLREQDAQVEMALHGALAEDLAPLEDSLAGRQAAFTDALADLAAALEGMGWPHVPVATVRQPDLRGARFGGAGAALTLQMTALAELFGDTPGPDRPVEEIVLAHERRYWRRTAKDHRVDLADVTLERAVAVAALCGAHEEDDGSAVLAQVPGLGDQSEDMRLRVARWVRDLYPPPSTGPQQAVPASGGSYWGSLQPDRLAEHLIARVVTERPALLTDLLTATSADQDHQALTVLSRASVTHAGLVPVLVDLLTGLPGLAPAAVRVVTQSEHPAALLTALTALIGGDHLSVEQLMVIADAVPHRTQALARFAADLEGKITEAYERMARQDPGTHLPDLASSLNNLSKRLRALDRRQAALAASQRSVDISEQLAAANPDAYFPILAGSLTNLSGQLGALDRWEEGLAAGQRAVEAYEQLAAANPDAYLPNLAHSLTNLSTRLSELGRREEGLAASQRAVEAYERLAAANPDAYLPNLASSLNNLSNRLGALGRREEGLTAIQRAVDISEQLAAANPDAYLPDLAHSLNNLSVWLGELSRREEGLAAIQRAVETYERLAAVNPDGYLPVLAMALTNLALDLGALGRWEEGLAAIQRAVEAYERLAAANPDAYLPNLANSLHNLSVQLGALGRHEEGLAPIRKAVRIRRALADANPDVYLPDLATSCLVNGQILIRPIPSADAVTLIMEALAIALERDLENLVQVAASLLKDAYRDNPSQTADAWRSATSTRPPDWMTQ